MKHHQKLKIRDMSDHRLLKWIMKKLRAWLVKIPDNYYDFEGRCVKCHERLNLLLTKDGNSVILQPENCSCGASEKDCIILWPFRDDIIDTDTGKSYSVENYKDSQVLRIVK